jgi:glycerol kinase
MSDHILAIDQGTTGTRVMLVDRAGQIESSEYAEFAQIYPKPGWVEHDPEVIYETTLKVMKKALAKSKIRPEKILGIGITNQRETTVLWDKKTLKPVHNAIVWQCRRSASICDALKEQGYEAQFRDKTGLLLDAYFSGTKVKWLLDEIPGLKTAAEKGKIAFGTIDTWLIAKLTRGKVHVTDYTNASRTLMFNIHTKSWDTDLLRVLGIPAGMLPTVVSSAEVVGRMDADILGAAIPIAGIAGDQQGALVGQGCFSPGQAKNTYGTGCFMLLNLADTKIAPAHGLILTLACGPDGMGAAFLAGLSTRLWASSRQVEKLRRSEKVFQPQMVDHARMRIYQGWIDADMYASGEVLGIK